jgi:hypothetical protein
MCFRGERPWGALWEPGGETPRSSLFAVVTAWVGARGRVTDLSAGHEPDFRIDYADGRVRLGEVTGDKHETVEAMWAMAHRSGGRIVWSLRGERGNSQWLCCSVIRPSCHGASRPPRAWNGQMHGHGPSRRN